MARKVVVHPDQMPMFDDPGEGHRAPFPGESDWWARQRDNLRKERERRHQRFVELAKDGKAVCRECGYVVVPEDRGGDVITTIAYGERPYHRNCSQAVRARMRMPK